MEGAEGAGGEAEDCGGLSGDTSARSDCCDSSDSQCEDGVERQDNDGGDGDDDAASADSSRGEGSGSSEEIDSTHDGASASVELERGEDEDGDEDTAAAAAAVGQSRPLQGGSGENGAWKKGRGVDGPRSAQSPASPTSSSSVDNASDQQLGMARGYCAADCSIAAQGR